jgi:hypothetical protein
MQRTRAHQQALDLTLVLGIRKLGVTAQWCIFIKPLGDFRAIAVSRASAGDD